MADTPPRSSTPARSPAASSASTTPPQDAVRNLVGEFLDEKRREETAELEASRPRKRNPAVLVVLVVLGVALWFAPSVLTPVDPPPSPERVEASTRMKVFLAAQRVLAYQRDTKRLPATLGEAGVDSIGLTYWRITNTTFDLRADAGGTTVIFRSGTGPAEFLGSTFGVLGSER